MHQNSYHRGKALRDLRRELGFTQETVARKLGMTARAYWNWENGTKNVSEHEYLGAKEIMINLSKKGEINEQFK